MPENNVFVNIDFSRSKDAINKALDSDLIEKAKQESMRVLEAQDEIKQNTKAVGGKLVFESGINLVVYIPYDEELVESFIDSYKDNIGSSTNIGIGRNPIESNKSLANFETEDMGNIVSSSIGLTEKLKENREFYKRSDKTSYDLKITSTIKSALLELNIITTEKKVYDIFLKLVEKNNLDTIDELQSFFYKPLEELKENIRDVYQSQKVAVDKTQTFPGKSEVIKTRQQKSPHRRFNWWSTEEYNQDAVDYRKTDLQYINDNISKDSQDMSMGGEPGLSINVT